MYIYTFTAPTPSARTRTCTRTRFHVCCLYGNMQTQSQKRPLYFSHSSAVPPLPKAVSCPQSNVWGVTSFVLNFIDSFVGWAMLHPMNVFVHAREKKSWGKNNSLSMSFYFYFESSRSLLTVAASSFRAFWLSWLRSSRTWISFWLWLVAHASPPALLGQLHLVTH